MPSKPKKLPSSTKVASVSVERLELATLKPHPRNPRVHPEKGTDRWETMKASIEHDYFDPLVFNRQNGMLVSGHFRLKVMQDSGFTHADVIVVNYDEATHIARMFAANKAAGENDLALQKELFLELRGLEGFDLSLTGFTLDEASAHFPSFSYLDEGDTSDNADSTKPAQHSEEPSAPEGEVRYLQVIYPRKQYEEVQALVAKFRADKAEELKDEFEDAKEDALTLPYILLFLLRKAVNE